MMHMCNCIHMLDAILNAFAIAVMEPVSHIHCKIVSTDMQHVKKMVLITLSSAQCADELYGVCTVTHSP